MMAILRDLKYGTKGFQLVMMGCFVFLPHLDQLLPKIDAYEIDL